eukprot:763197-Hanusia_phi.AAC.1
MDVTSWPRHGRAGRSPWHGSRCRSVVSPTGITVLVTALPGPEFKELPPAFWAVTRTLRPGVGTFDFGI